MSTTPVNVPNPLTWLTDFIGSANVQKTLAGIQVYLGAATGVEGKSLGAHVANTTIGGAYAIAVHYIDYLRAKVK